MSVDLTKALKAGRKLRKMLKSFPAHPAPKDVHTLRTHTRMLQATVHALFPGDDPKAQRLLRAVKPVLKTAGRVRDMDVLIEKAIALRVTPEQESMAKLVQYMSAMRKQHRQKLADVIDRRGKKGRRLLNRYMRRLADTVGSEEEDDSSARMQCLAAELDHWPKLRADNLHAFRVRAKELRYMMQLMADEDRAGIKALGRIKDTAGEWHDWLALQAIAEEVLDAAKDATVLNEIRRTAREKLRVALTTANAVRKERPTKLAA